MSEVRRPPPAAVCQRCLFADLWRWRPRRIGR
eukprot:SAG22_NODE_12597_length_436_cov_1.801187_1_plen_31_part_01